MGILSPWSHKTKQRLYSLGRTFIFLLTLLLVCMKFVTFLTLIRNLHPNVRLILAIGIGGLVSLLMPPRRLGNSCSCWLGYGDFEFALAGRIHDDQYGMLI
jgi:hypothetical protein